MANSDFKILCIIQKNEPQRIESIESHKNMWNVLVALCMKT
jgi:hypothetical protein